MNKEALTLAHEELKHIKTWCLRSIGIGLVNENVLSKIEEALAQPEHEKERCVGCDACIDTACGRDECPKGWPKAAQPEQEPVAFLVYAKGSRRYFTLTFDVEKVPEIYKGGEAVPLYTTPPQRKPLTDDEKENAFLVTTTSDFDPLRNFFDGVAFAEIYYGIKE